MRNLCKICKQRPCAINYYKEDRIFYRSKCDHCAKDRKIGQPYWEQAGYKKKAKCDRCGFASVHPQQFDVYHVDGNLVNSDYKNLKTVCANCQRLLHSLHLPWRRGDLIPDN